MRGSPIADDIDLGLFIGLCEPGLLITGSGGLFGLKGRTEGAEGLRHRFQLDGWSATRTSRCAKVIIDLERGGEGGPAFLSWPVGPEVTKDFLESTYMPLWRRACGYIAG